MAILFGRTLGRREYEIFVRGLLTLPMDIVEMVIRGRSGFFGKGTEIYMCDAPPVCTHAIPVIEVIIQNYSLREKVDNSIALLLYSRHSSIEYYFLLLYS